MCENRPGVRCSDHAQKPLTKAEEFLTLAEANLRAAETTLGNLTPGTPGHGAQQRRVAQAAKTHTHALEKVRAAETTYDATPRGEQALLTRLNATETTETERDLLKNRVDASRVYRTWQRAAGKKVEELTKTAGPEAAISWAEQELAVAEAKLNEAEANLAAMREAEIARVAALDEADATRREALAEMGEPQVHPLVTAFLTANKIYNRVARFHSVYYLIRGDMKKFIRLHKNSLKRAAHKKIQTTLRQKLEPTRKPKAPVAKKRTLKPIAFPKGEPVTA